MTPKINYFPEYILRTSLLPLPFYLNLLQDYSKDKVLEMYKLPLIREAIYLASSDLDNELNKWKTESNSLSAEKSKALELSLVKYLTRMSSRCTPFGLFAGCSVGKIDFQTKVILDITPKHKRFTQFDMQFWVAILQDIASRKEVAMYLKYFPNTSIYGLGDFYRYIEYKYIETKREHSISALRKSELLKKILIHTKSGITIDEMISFLANDDSEKAEALGFVFQLIDFQFLVSELDAVVTGNDEWKRVFMILNKIPSLKKETKILHDIQNQISNLDLNLVPIKEQYEEIKKNIQKLKFKYDEKFLFQTDLNTVTFANTLDVSIVKKTAEGIRFLNGIQPKKHFKNLENFKKAFLHRYETREMPLTMVLDTEAGIGYVQNQGLNDTHELLEKFSFKGKKKEKRNQPFSSFDFILQKKLQQSVVGNQMEVVLSKNDFPDFNDTFTDAPATFSVMIEMFDTENIVITSSESISAAKLLGRFCHSNLSIHNLTKKIVEKEEQYHKDKIVAEIAHIPESRTGNILRRPVLRNYEIAYLANSENSKENNIDLNDLWISVKNDTIILRSKKHNKEIHPCLSNAHNYSNNSLPIYHFLCDMQAQRTKLIYSFSWGILESFYTFFPRVTYKNIILSKAKWIISKKELDFFSKLNEIELFEKFSVWRLERNMPRYVNWVYYDNTLLLDFEAQISIQIFLKSVQKYNQIIVEEFLFTKKSPVKNHQGDFFCNQFILSFYKDLS